MGISTKAIRALLLLGLLTALTIHGAQAQDPEQPSQAEIDEAFKLFNHHPDANLRKAAKDWLVSVGEPAIPGFEAALASKDPINREEITAAIGVIKSRPNIPVRVVQTDKAILEKEKSIVANFKEEPTPSHGKLSPGDIEWKVVRTQVPSGVEGAREYDYALRFKGEAQTIPLVTSNVEFALGENFFYVCDQACSDSFKVYLLRSPDLISVDWGYVSQPGTGYYTEAACMLLLKTDSGWKKIHRNSYTSFGRGGPDDYSYESEKFAWDSKNAVLKIEHENRSEYKSSEPEPLSVMTEEGGYKTYTQNITGITERLFQIKGETLEYLGGKRIIEPGPGTFKLADIPVYLDNDKADPAKTIAKIRKLNPKLGKSEEFQGALVLETGIPAKDKDE